MSDVPAGWPGSASAVKGATAMATNSPAPAPSAAPSETVFQKIWGWLTKEVTVVENDLAGLIGSGEAEKLEAIGKNLLSGFLGPLAAAAIADATNVATGEMSVSKAIASLIQLAETDGKKLSQAAALQVIALAQNALPTAGGQTVTPVA